LIVSIGGLWYPKLGYFLILVFATLMFISPFKGRWFCGNLCPRGSFNDFWLKKISRNKKIPKLLRSFGFRITIFMIFILFTLYRISSIEKTVDKIGFLFVIMCLLTTLIAIILGIAYSPRAWCSFCPMGTLQRWFGGNKYQLKFNKEKCIVCNLCNKVCPMQLNVNTKRIKLDCIKCKRCIDICNVKALEF
jgi:polyferredoxin